MPESDWEAILQNNPQLADRFSKSVARMLPEKAIYQAAEILEMLKSQSKTIEIIKFQEAAIVDHKFISSWILVTLNFQRFVSIFP